MAVRGLPSLKTLNGLPLGAADSPFAFEFDHEGTQNQTNDFSSVTKDTIKVGVPAGLAVGLSSFAASRLVPLSV